MKCKDVQKELKAFLSDDLEKSRRDDIKKHLDACPNCSQECRKLQKLSVVLKQWEAIEPSSMMYEQLNTRIKAYESFWRRIFATSFCKKLAIQSIAVIAIVALTLSINHLLHKPQIGIQNESATIQFYFTEHQDLAARSASAEFLSHSTAQLRVNRDDILYYEFMNKLPLSTRPGIILRGNLPQPEMTGTQEPAISNGDIITPSKAQKAAHFDLVAPPRIHPAYRLDIVKKIQGRNSFHLLYTNGINSFSVFEQPVDDEDKLLAQDFREYALYRSDKQSATILAWNKNAVSFVLIGDADLSQLMDIIPAFSTTSRSK